MNAENQDLLAQQGQVVPWELLERQESEVPLVQLGQEDLLDLLDRLESGDQQDQLGKLVLLGREVQEVLMEPLVQLEAQAKEALMDQLDR